MQDKLNETVDKTIEALERIERFIIKYGDDLDEDQLFKIDNKLKVLQNKVSSY
jgi:trehalose-6-phosphatase